ncbi:MAG: hypothetical protein ABSH33_23965 [Steroidobacteraceae bacterium]
MGRRINHQECLERRPLALVQVRADALPLRRVDLAVNSSGKASQRVQARQFETIAHQGIHGGIDEIRRIRTRLSNVHHGPAGEIASGCAPGGDPQPFKDRTLVPVERAIGIQVSDFLIDIDLSRQVLNGRLRDLLDGQESTDRLKGLQLREQRYLG